MLELGGGPPGWVARRRLAATFLGMTNLAILTPRRVRTAPPVGATLYVLLPACVVVALMGLRNALANYELGADGRLHRVGALMMAAALLASLATGASTMAVFTPFRRWGFVLIAVTLVASALLWGLPAAAHARAAAHVCACEGG